MELLIVMVIVGLLVTMVLPKYKSAMEKGRGLEGVANVSAVSEAVNAYYVRNGGSYGSSDTNLKKFVLGEDGAAAVTKNMNFRDPVITWNSSSEVVVSSTRDISANPYTITFVNKSGSIFSRTCSGNEKYCQELGAKCTESSCTL